MNENKQVKFIPFHAINEFMRHDFRIHVIKSTLAAIPNLDDKFVARIDRLTRKLVKVPGFRNSSKAPTSIKAVAMAKTFEKHPDFVAAILNTWAESKPDFRNDVSNFLSKRGWTILPAEADRTKLPGFLTTWPKGEDYDTLYQAYVHDYPDSNASIDELSLMIIWQAGRLPIDKINISEIRDQDESQDSHL